MPRTLRHLALLAAVGVVACKDDPVRVSDPMPETRTVVETFDATARRRYFEDASARRSMLEGSLQNPDNGYSRDRLAAYGLADAGWELLPVWNPRAIALGPSEVAAIVGGGAPVLPPATRPIWDGVAPTSAEGWRALGRRVFFELPLRADESIAHALRDPARAASHGLVAAADGTYPGLVVFEDVDGSARVGITCALCHSSLVDGRPWPGLARRDLDYGAVRLAYHAERNVPLDDELRERMTRWGKGRADITGDDDEDPVAIPDLWSLLDLTALTQAATIRLAGDRIADEADRRAHDLFVLAIRQETQVIQANGERARPPRELAWAMASYVAELAPPPTAISATDGVREGRALFEEHCRECHDGPAKSGRPIAAEAVGTDRALADSRARGTGKFRPAPLVAVGRAAPYFHDGSVATLADVLDPARLDASFTRGVRRPGAVPGHTFGTTLPSDQRAALVAYLATL